MRRRRRENNKIMEKGIKKEKGLGGKRSVKKDSSLSLTILIDSVLNTEYFTLFVIIRG